jgi:hypothetical protein
MNFDKLKRNVGYQVKLKPSACHLSPTGDLLLAQDEDWIIVAVTADYIETETLAGCRYRLGKDHVHHFTSDPHRSTELTKHGFLTLNVQLFIQGIEVWATPNSQPGAAVAPDNNVSTAEKARSYFTPELERLFRRQVWVLGRIIPNYTMTSLEKESCGDSWESLRPAPSVLYPNSPFLRDLSPTDVGLVAEFCNALQEVQDILADWIGSQPLSEYNCWNFLMAKVQHSLWVGAQAIERFCPDRQYDATMPASGTLLSQATRALSNADQARNAFMVRVAAKNAVTAATSIAAESLRAVGSRPHRLRRNVMARTAMK